MSVSGGGGGGEVTDLERCMSQAVFTAPGHPGRRTVNLPAPPADASVFSFVRRICQRLPLAAPEECVEDGKGSLASAAIMTTVIK